MSPEVFSIALGVVGLATVVFTALSWRRNDTGAVVSQQTSILENMKTLNDELRVTASDLRSERDRCYEEVAKLKQATDRIERRLE